MARRRVRDYAAEYARRVRGTKRGSPQRASARGHAEESPRAQPRSTWRRIAEAAEAAVSSALVGRPGRRGLVFVAVDEKGRTTVVPIKPGVPTSTIRDELRRRGVTISAEGYGGVTYQQPKGVKR